MNLSDILRKDVTRNLARLQPEIFRDMKESIDMLFGENCDSWHEITLFETMSKIIFKAQSRVFVGEPLCKNTAFLTSVANFANWVGAGGIIVGQYTPRILKPFLGYAAAIPIYVMQRIAFRHLIPEVKQRLARLNKKNDPSNLSSERSNDMLMWMVISAANRKHPKGDQPEAIAQRILFMVSEHFLRLGKKTNKNCRCWALSIQLS